MGPTVTSIRGQRGNQTDRLPAAGVGTTDRQKGWIGGNGKVKVDTCRISLVPNSTAADLSLMP